jgi:hypothetical protein
MTEVMLAFFNHQPGKNLKPIFDQYLSLPVLQRLALRRDVASMAH